MLTLFSIVAAIYGTTLVGLLIVGVLCLVSRRFRAHIVPLDSPATASRTMRLVLVSDNPSRGLSFDQIRAA